MILIWWYVPHTESVSHRLNAVDCIQQVGVSYNINSVSGKSRSDVYKAPNMEINQEGEGVQGEEEH